MVIQGLRRSCTRSYLNLMHNKPCFNLPHSQESMNPEDDIYHVQPHLQEPSYNDLDINEKQMIEHAIGGIHVFMHLLIPSYIV